MADIEIIKGADNGNPPDTLPQMYPKVNRNFDKLNKEIANNKKDINNKLEAHKNSTAAHPAENIPYTGAVIGASNTKQALDNLKTTIDDLVLGSGESGPEVAAARGGFSTIGDRLDASDALLEKKANKIEPTILKSLRNGNGNILLVGDSIGAGVGTPNYSIPPTNPIIFTDTDGTIYREADYINGGWANWLRNYLNTFYSDATYRNISIGGKSARWFCNRKELIFTESYGTILLSLGANDCWDTNNETDYIRYMQELIDFLSPKCDEIILICTPYFTQAGEQIDYMRYSMQRINKALREIAANNDLALVDTFTYFKDYVGKHKIDESAILRTDGIHPTEAGYRVMWEKIRSDLGLYSPNADIKDDGFIYVDNTATETLYTFGEPSRPFYRLRRALEYVATLPKGKYKIKIKQGASYSGEVGLTFKGVDVELISSNPAESINFTDITIDNASVDFKGYMLLISNINVINGSKVKIDKLFNGGSSAVTGLVVDGGSYCEIGEFTVTGKSVTPFKVINTSTLNIQRVPQALSNNSPFVIDKSTLIVPSAAMRLLNAHTNSGGKIIYNDGLVVVQNRGSINKETAANDPVFQEGKITIVHFTISENGGFPGGAGGTLITDKSYGIASGGLCTQVFKVANSDDVYFRTWKSDGSGYTSFRKVVTEIFNG